MNPKTLRKCIRKAKAFARQYSFHPKFRQYTEDEIAIGGTLSRALLVEHRNYKHAGRLPIPNDDIDRLYADIGLDNVQQAEFDRAAEVCDTLLDLCKVESNGEEPNSNGNPP